MKSEREIIKLRLVEIRAEIENLSEKPKNVRTGLENVRIKSALNLHDLLRKKRSYCSLASQEKPADIAKFILASFDVLFHEQTFWWMADEHQIFYDLVDQIRPVARMLEKIKSSRSFSQVWKNPHLEYPLKELIRPADQLIEVSKNFNAAQVESMRSPRSNRVSKKDRRYDLAFKIYLKSCHIFREPPHYKILVELLNSPDFHGSFSNVKPWKDEQALAKKISAMKRYPLKKKR